MKTFLSSIYLLLFLLCMMAAYFVVFHPSTLRKWINKHLKTPTIDRRSRNLQDFGVAIPSDYAVHGIDISRYQEDIDWADVSKMRIHQTEIKFAFIKATEGDKHQDIFFERNWMQSKKNGIIRGAYHFYNPNIKSSLQAKNFIETVKLEKGDLPPVLDIESVGDLSIQNLQKGLANWLKMVEEHYQIQPIIYTNLNFYKKYLRVRFKSYRFWIAQYEAEKIQLDSKKWFFWQHTNKGKVNGIAGHVDLNVFNGDFEKFMQLCKP